MFPQGRRIHGLIKNVIADVIKRCVMIHDNNYAAGKTTPCDLVNVRGMAKSIPGFITDKRRQTRRLPADTDRNAAAGEATANCEAAHTQSRLSAVDFGFEKLKRSNPNKNQCEIVRGGIRFAVDLPARVTNGLGGLTCLQERLEQMRVSG